MFIEVIMFDPHSEVDFGPAIVNLNNVLKIVPYSYKGFSTIEFTNGEMLTIKNLYKDIRKELIEDETRNICQTN